MDTKEDKPLKNRWWIWVLSGLFILVIVWTLLSFLVLQPWLQNKIESTVKEESDGVYTLRMGGFNTSLLTGSLTIDELDLTPDYKLWEQQYENQHPDSVPATLVNLNAKQLRIDGISYLSLIFSDKLELDELYLDHPEITITQMREDTTESKPPHEQLQGQLESLAVGTIQVDSAHIVYKTDHEHDYNAAEIKGFNLLVRNVRVDSAAYASENRVFYSESVEANARSADVLMLPKGFYRLRTGHVSLATLDEQIQLENLELIPLYTQAEMSRRDGEAVTLMRLQVPAVRMGGVGFASFSRSGNVAVKSIQVQQPDLNAYMDIQNFGRETEKPLPHDMIQELKMGLNIEEVTVNGMHIRYEELAEDANETGHITFSNLDATITNLSNDKNSMSADNPAVLKANAAIMGSMPINVTMRFDLLDPDCYHAISGSVGTADPEQLNPILEPTSFVSVKSGTVQNGEFNIELYRNNASGRMHLIYENFKVDLLTEDEDTRQSFGKEVLSKVANELVLNNNNPAAGEEPRVGKIDVVRAKKRSVLNYWKDCLASGLLDIAGVEGMGADLQDPTR